MMGSALVDLIQILAQKGVLQNSEAIALLDLIANQANAQKDTLDKTGKDDE